MDIMGCHLIGNDDIKNRAGDYEGHVAQGSVAADIDFPDAGSEEIAAACRLASRDFDRFRDSDPASRAAFLRAIGEEIEKLGDALLERCSHETALPLARLQGERGRTVGQLNLFADMLDSGDWQETLSVTRDLTRPGIFQTKLARRDIAVGPVAVFGASNFPLAFSVAGGDTASALAAGCPVVVKAHPGHPGTSELVGRAIRAAAQRSGMPEGSFSLLFGKGEETGRLLVLHPAIKAVGFTGSRRGGTALMALGAGRDEPIPVYAEMGSINPVFLLPGALEADSAGLAAGFVGSLNMGVGQFCTNPGLLVGLAGAALDAFTAAAGTAIEQSTAAKMLSPAIARAFGEGVARLGKLTGVRQVAAASAGNDENFARPALFATNAPAFRQTPDLGEENFGPSSIIVACSSEEEMIGLADALEGQLTTTLHFVERDATLAKRLLPILERKCGRIVGNGWPTGVEVSPAMVHGGPFPSSSDARSTSVGSMAIRRFLRPVSYQDIPDWILAF